MWFPDGCEEEAQQEPFTTATGSSINAAVTPRAIYVPTFKKVVLEGQKPKDNIQQLKASDFRLCLILILRPSWGGPFRCFDTVTTTINY